MPAIGRRRRWLPPAWAKIDWSHPLTRGLVFYGLRDKDYVTGVVASKTGTVGAVAGSLGQASKATSGGYYGWTLTTSPAQGMTAFSAAFHGQVPASGETIRMGQWGATNYSWLLECGADFGVVMTTWGGGSFTGTYPGSAAGSPVPGEWATVSSSRNSGSGTYDLWMRGARIQAASSVGAPDNFPTVPFTVLNAPGDTGNGIMSVYALWNREISPAEHVQFAADPFIFMRW